MWREACLRSVFRLTAIDFLIVFLFFGSGCLRAEKDANQEKVMESEWLKNKLRSNGLSTVFFEFEDIDLGSLGEGPRAAIRSAESWQEDLLSEDFQVPKIALRKIHHRREKEPDALYFKYKTIDFEVEVWHQMDIMIIVLTPNELTAKEFEKEKLKPVQIVDKVARRLLLNAEAIELEKTESDRGIYFGTHKRIDGKESGELTPVELMRWWYTKGEIGFAVLKISPVIDGNVPSSAGLSDQQIHMWFDAITAKRY